MEHNVDTISTYSFTTKPSCVDLGCCQNVSLQTGNNPSFIYNGFTLNISGGLNPTFTFNGNTGTINCGTENQGMHIYKGTETNSGTASHVTFFDLNNLNFSGFNVQALLSGQTIYLQKLLNIVVKAFPSNRVYQTTNNANS